MMQYAVSRSCRGAGFLRWTVPVGVRGCVFRIDRDNVQRRVKRKEIRIQSYEFCIYVSGLTWNLGGFALLHIRPAT